MTLDGSACSRGEWSRLACVLSKSRTATGIITSISATRFPRAARRLSRGRQPARTVVSEAAPEELTVKALTASSQLLLTDRFFIGVCNASTRASPPLPPAADSPLAPPPLPPPPQPRTAPGSSATKVLFPLMCCSRSSRHFLRPSRLEKSTTSHSRLQFVGGWSVGREVKGGGKREQGGQEEEEPR